MTSTILYLYGYSPRMRKTLGRLREAIAHQLKIGYEVCIVLLHDGVTGAAPRGTIPDNIRSLMDLGVKIYALGADLDARGLSDLPLGEKIVRIDYDQLIEKIVECHTLFSWM